ncbi:ATP-binding protein [Streptomyces sp. NPDC091289]|uniref:ATP-binding protein n=1 Tax=Streptomyces sp. NPDC091289 TaxID=3365989 RepID=UPI00380A2F71
MPPSSRAALCPATVEGPASSAPHSPPLTSSERGLALSVTLLGDPRSAAVGRALLTAALRTHGLTRYAWPAWPAGPAGLAMGELLSVAARMAPDKELYVFVRERDDALRLVTWDQHTGHDDPGVAALCRSRRRRALWLLAAVVADWGGAWGTDGALPPHRGTKTWVLLPR